MSGGNLRSGTAPVCGDRPGSAPSSLDPRMMAAGRGLETHHTITAASCRGQGHNDRAAWQDPRRTIDRRGTTDRHRRARRKCQRTARRTLDPLTVVKPTEVELLVPVGHSGCGEAVDDALANRVVIEPGDTLGQEGQVPRIVPEAAVDTLPDDLGQRAHTPGDRGPSPASRGNAARGRPRTRSVGVPEARSARAGTGPQSRRSRRP